MKIKFPLGLFEKKTRISSIFILLMILNIINLLLGLATNTILAAKFGAGALKDGLELSFSTSRNVLSTFGLGSLGGSALYVIARMSSIKRNRMESYISSVFLIQFMYSIIFFMVLIIYAESIIDLLSPGMPDDIRHIAITCITWTAWIVLLQPIIDLLGSVNTGLQIYGTLQTGMVLQKLCLIVGIMSIDLFGPIAYPAGNIAGLVACIILLLAVLYRSGMRLSTQISFRSKAIKESFKLSLPWLVSSPVLNFASWVIIPIMIGLGPGFYSSYLYAMALYTMMIAVIVTPFSDGFSPMMAKYAGLPQEQREGKNQEEQILISLGFRTSFMIGVLIASVAVVSSKPLVSLIFFHGAMTLESASQISRLLNIIGIGLIGQSVTIFLCRFFQARISMTSYILSQIVSPIIMILIIYLLIKPMGIYAVAWGITVSSILGAGISWFLAKRLTNKNTLSLDKKFLQWICLLIIFTLGLYFLPISIHKSFIRNISNLVIMCSAIIIISWVTAYLLKIPEYELVKTLIKNKYLSIVRT